MKKVLFNDDWIVEVKQNGWFTQPSPDARRVTLPYDPMIFTAPSKDALPGSKSGYFNSGSWEYKKTFFIPAEDGGKHVVFRFDGVYRRAMVYINGDYAGGRMNGYSQFLVNADALLKFGAENEIKVVVHTSDDERWYTGAGIYRDVYMLTSPLTRIEPNGVKVHTTEVTGDSAVINAAVTLAADNAAKEQVRVNIAIFDAQGNEVSSSTAPVTLLRNERAVSRVRLLIENPDLWSAETPSLYKCCVSIADADGNVIDESEETFGIRSLCLDVKNGLRVNGQTVKLRGACVHHDNGPLGAISTLDVETRKVKKLKDAGFNAIRTAHNPASPALLSACDSLGMFVMEEAFDMWTLGKTDFDYAIDFPDHWEEDVAAMVDKSYNNPSVIIYSIGNEIAETGSAAGSVWGRLLAEKIRSLDGTRYITNGVNGMLSAMPVIMAAQAELAKRQEAEVKQGGEINTMMADAGAAMKSVMTMPAVTNLTEESFAYLDIAGYNYMDTRYENDRELFPNRVICGTETYSKDIDILWKKVNGNSRVIGDFTWTGWDYLGEAGIGRITYEKRDIHKLIYADFPSLTAMCGDISITGFRRPASYYREIVFGFRKEPYIAVQPPVHYNDTLATTPWSFTDAVCDWNWKGFEGKPVKVEVYADADEVELLINGVSVGKQTTERYRAVFDAVYAAGEIKAAAYKGGVKTGEFTVSTDDAGCGLAAVPEKAAVKPGEYVFINVTASANVKARVAVEGAGELVSFATDDPSPTELFSDNERALYEGRALAVVRPTSAGSISVTVSADGFEQARCEVISEEDNDEY